MELVLSHNTALEFWRNQQHLPQRKTRQVKRIDGAAARVRVTLPDQLASIDHLLDFGLTLPIDILLSRSAIRQRTTTVKWSESQQESTPLTIQRSQIIRQHTFSGKVPPGSLVRTESGYLISSPEFCFLQMASSLSLIELIELGYELCGSYALPADNKKGQSPDDAYNCQALTKAQKIETYLESFQGVTGHAKSTRASRYVLNGSASPMETKLTMLLVLPHQLGGFGIPHPILNAKLNPIRVAKQAANRKYYSCDLFWPEHKLAVEYDSKLFHTGLQRIASDSQKRNALLALGIKVVTITSRQLLDKYEMDKVAHILATHMGKRLQLSRSKSFTKTHQALRDHLL
jgi:very-short-patch-repair endonuclease